MSRISVEVSIEDASDSLGGSEGEHTLKFTRRYDEHNASSCLHFLTTDELVNLQAAIQERLEKVPF